MRELYALPDTQKCSAECGQGLGSFNPGSTQSNRRIMGRKGPRHAHNCDGNFEEWLEDSEFHRLWLKSGQA